MNMKRSMLCTAGLCLMLTATQAQTDSIVRMGACATPGQAFGVHVQGDYAYVADGGRLTAVSVAELTAPYVVDDFSDIHVSPVGVFVQDTIAYNNNGFYTRFSTVSIGDPWNLYRLGWCLLPATGVQPKGIVMSDTIAYLAQGTEGVQIINVARPDSPSILATYDTPGWTMDLRVKDTLLYIADWDSMRIVNVSSPDSPFRVGACAMPAACWDVDVKDSFAYVACQSWDGYNGRLLSVDISEPSNPAISDAVYMRGDPVAVFVRSNHAYVASADFWAKAEEKRGPFEMSTRNRDRKADVEGGLRIVNIDNPDSLELVGDYDTPGWPEDVFVVGNLVYIADEDSLQILRHLDVRVEEDVARSHRSEPLRIVGSYPNPFSLSIHVEYQVSDSDQPVVLDVYDISGKLVRRIANADTRERHNTIVWDGKDEKGEQVPGGIYFYEVNNGCCSARSKLVIMR